MKKNILLSTLTCLTFSPWFSGSAVAAKGDVPEAREFYWEFGFRSQNYKYEEPGKMKITGAHRGLDYKYTVHYKTLPEQESYPLFRNDIEIVSGNTSYDGQTLAGEKRVSPSNEFITDFRLFGGYQFGPLSRYQLRLLGGLGWRFLSNRIGGFGGYDREKSYVYFPLVASVHSALGANSEVGIETEYDIFAAGTVYTHLEDVDPSLSTAVNEQDEGHGFRLGSYYLYRFKALALKLEAFYRAWNIEDSNKTIIGYSADRLTTYTVQEPKNTMRTTGVNLTMVF